MASIVKREGKSGITYRIQVKVKDRGSGKTITHSTTFKPTKGLTEKQMQREAVIFADEYESSIKESTNSCDGETFASGETTLSEYARQWLERRKEEISATYYVNCQIAIEHITENIGSYKLKELTPAIIQRYFDKIDKRERTIVTVSPNPDAIREQMEVSGKKYMELRYKEKINSCSLANALKGKHISEDFAKQLAKLLGCKVNTICTIEKRKETFAFESNHKIKRTLRVILASAKKQRIIADNYASSDFINFPKRPPHEIDYMNDEDAKKFYNAASSYEDIRIKTATMILLMTGMRRGELCGLEWDDIDLEEKTISIKRSVVAVKSLGVITKEPKTESSKRIIGISDNLTAVIREYKEWYDNYREALGDRWINSNRLFIKENGDGLYPSTVEGWVHKICQAAGLPNRTVHSLRHTNITMQIAAGVPLVTVSGRAGHARTSTTTDIYSHFLKSSDRTAAKTLENVFCKG